MLLQPNLPCSKGLEGPGPFVLSLSKAIPKGIAQAHSSQNGINRCVQAVRTPARAQLPNGFLRPAGAGDITAVEKVEGQSAQDQNVGRKHQKGVELPWSIPLSGAGEALCISTTHEDADIIDQQEVRHVLEPVEEIDEDA